MTHIAQTTFNRANLALLAAIEFCDNAEECHGFTSTVFALLNHEYVSPAFPSSSPSQAAPPPHDPASLRPGESRRMTVHAG